MAGRAKGGTGGMSPSEHVDSPLSPFLQSQGVVILDGGLGTELERQGATLDPKLWSAGTAIDAPHILQAVHTSYLEAGADVIIAASYQASIGGLCQWRGYSTDEAEQALRRTVQLACEARDSFWDRHRDQQGEASEKRTRRRPLVAASVGCYGASLADGSEYRGEYGLTVEELKAWHAPRFKLLAKAGADLLAIETLPCEVEVRAILALLEEDTELRDVPCWVSMACRNGQQLNSGDSLEASVRLIRGCTANILSVGVNCTAPQYVAEALAVLAKIVGDTQTHHGGSSTRPPPLLHAYPNSGEVYVDKQWLEASGTPDGVLATMAVDWVKKYGVRLVGGCCRTTPDTIRALRSALVPE